MSKLTEEERRTLDAACAIIVSHTPHGASWLISFYPTGAVGPAYFDSLRTQHMLWDMATLSSVVERGIEMESTVETRREDAKNVRIAELKAELEKLGAAA